MTWFGLLWLVGLCVWAWRCHYPGKKLGGEHVLNGGRGGRETPPPAGGRETLSGHGKMIMSRTVHAGKARGELARYALEPLKGWLGPWNVA